MKLPRRHFLHLAVGAAALPAVSRFARAQAYPTRPVRIIVGFAPGGGVDITARLIAQWLSERLGHQFVIENRPGAATNIATEAVVRSPPDGYTLLLVNSTNAINATLYDRLNFNFIRDIAPVAGIMVVPNVMVVNPSVPARTVPAFIAYAKANPGKINMGSGGNGLVDLLAGQVQVYFPTMPASIGYVRAGTLRALAVTTATRSEALPDVPTVGEFVPSYEATTWYGVGVPKNTPAEIIDKLNQEVNAALADPKIKTRLADLGGTPLPGSPAQFGKLIADETEKWGKVIQALNIKAD
jgi:tripartite-type tricarboxylate transporter receptor subunit TctC